MDRRTWAFAAAALGVTVVLAVAVSPFASSAPDGLERVLADHRVAVESPDRPVWEGAPVADYRVPGIDDERKAVALAGLVGLGIMFGGSYAIAKLMIRTKRRDDERTKP